MRWHFGGNLQPVRMICEYDWKECPTAVVSYIWSEIVTDVVDGLTGETQLWRIIAIMILCSMFLRTVYYKIRWVDKSEDDSTRDHLIKVGFKMQDLELKINILTYKIQYGIWPLPNEIPTPSLTQLKNVKLTLSNTGRRNTWSKHHSHRCISQCIQNSEDDKSTKKHLSAIERMELVHRNFLSQFRNRNDDFDAINLSEKLELLKEKDDSKSYERLVKTAKECRKYMNEINESNKTLGLFDNSSDVSDSNSIKDYCVGTESEPNSLGFPVNLKKWDKIYKQGNSKEDREVKERDLTTFSPIFSTSNYKRMDTMFPTDNERYTLKSSRSKSKLLPPGLSITFLSDEFENLPLNDKCVGAEDVRKNKNKSSTNETLNKVKKKLESLHDIKHIIENSMSINNLKESPQDNEKSETNFFVKRNSTMSAYNGEGKNGKKITVSNNSGKTNSERFDQPTSTECDSSCSGNNEATLNSIAIRRGSGIFAEKMRGRYLYPQNEREETKTQRLNDRNTKSVQTTIIRSFSSVGNGQITRDSGSNNINVSIENSKEACNEKKKNTLSSPIKMSSMGCSVGKSLSRLALREENLSAESDSSVSFTVNSTVEQNRVINSNISEQRLFDLSRNVVTSSNNNNNNNNTSMEANINLSPANRRENFIPKRSRSYHVVSPINKSERQTFIEIDEDPTLISQTSSQTEISKDSDTDEKSTATLLREALEFKKALLLQIRRESETSGEKSFVRNESSECDSDDTPRSKTDNRFPSKLLDIISEEQSAGSSTEKTSRTYIVSRSINEANLDKNFHKPANENDNVESLNSCKVTLDGECYGDSKSPVTVTSSEYFSTNNITDNEHASSPKINQPVADGDGLRGARMSNLRQSPEDLLKLNVTNYEHGNNGKPFSNANSKENKAKEESESSTAALRESRDIPNEQNTISQIDSSLQSPVRNKKCEDNTAKLNNFIEVVKSVDDVSKNGKSFDQICNNQPEKMKEQLDPVVENTGNKDDAKIQFFRSWSSIDSEKGISWNAISESSSSESITNFVNALTNLESKNIDKITEQKLMMLNSTDYEGRNFARAGENAQYSFNSRAKKQPGLVSISDINISERGHGIMDEILEMIAQSAIFKFNKTETKDANSSTSATNAINATSTENHSEELDLFKSHSMLKLDQEKLQRKHDILSKLKTLDAFTKPLDISECGPEKNDNEENASPMTGRTVVCTSNINMTKNNETSTKTEREVLGKQFPHSSSTSRETEQDEVAKQSKTVIEGTETCFTGSKMSSTQCVRPSENSSIDHQVSESDMNSRNNNTIINPRKNQLSKSSITNFSTDTSDSYFDISNHDFAVSSIILTSQNSNLAPRPEDDTLKSDTSSLYVDASDYCSKIPIDSSLTKSHAKSNLAGKKNYSSESQIVNVKTKTTENTHQGDVATHNNLCSKHESLIKTQPLPKSTSSSLLNDQKGQLIVSRGEFSAERKRSSEESKSKRTKDPVNAESRSSLNQDASKRSSSLNLERSCSKVEAGLARGKTTSKSCIPILKSRIEIPKRAKSMETEPRSRSPVRKSSTPISQNTESSYLMGAATSDSNETEKQKRQSISGSRKSLNPKQSYTLPPKNDTREESANRNNDCKIVRSITKELTVTPEKCNLLNGSNNLPKECTVIYINIISDADRSETQTFDANEIIKYVNEDIIFRDGRLDSKSLSLKNITFDRSKETKCTANSTSDGELCKNLSDSFEIESDKYSNTTQNTADLKQGEERSEVENNSEKVMRLARNVTSTANKRSSTSTLELSNSAKVERREIEVSAKPSVKNTSTSVSDFPEASPTEKCSIYNPSIKEFDLSNELIKKEQIVLSEMLNSDPNFFECRKTHKLYNKLGLGFQEQTE